MVKVTVVNFDGRRTDYDVDYPIAYCEKIRESQNALVFESKNVSEVYVDDKLKEKFPKSLSYIYHHTLASVLKYEISSFVSSESLARKKTSESIPLSDQ